MVADLLDDLLENSTSLINICEIDYERYFLKKIDFNQKLVGIVGARGVGKTTAILQHLKKLDIGFDRKLII